MVAYQTDVVRAWEVSASGRSLPEIGKSALYVALKWGGFDGTTIDGIPADPAIGIPWHSGYSCK